jgi:3-deoxy-D-manno-octulosonic acid kinase
VVQARAAGTLGRRALALSLSQATASPVVAMGMSVAKIPDANLQRDGDGRSAILSDVALAQADASLFDPEAYGPRARRVEGEGGRGSAWFVEGAFGQGVLRHYRRGGWAARLSRDAYVWQGEEATRSFREFRFTAALRAQGLPVPKPLAAWYRRQGVFYRAALLMQRIPGVRSFGACVAVQGSDAPWEGVGRALGRCHAVGARHADGNATNILVDGEAQAWIIDWDRGRIDRDVSAWQEVVFSRLRRSFRKVAPGIAEPVIEDGMRRLRAAHDVELRR